MKVFHGERVAFTNWLRERVVGTAYSESPEYVSIKALNEAPQWGAQYHHIPVADVMELTEAQEVVPSGDVAPFATRVALAVIAWQERVSLQIIAEMVAEGTWPTD
jgi:hypothetical protein